MRMNKLARDKRIQIISLLVEGMSLRATTRITGVSINTVTKLLVDAGKACDEFQDMAFRHLKSERVQVDEIWAFCYAKQRNAEVAKAAPEGAGDVWTWTAIDADSKLVMSWMIGDRSGQTAQKFINDLARRLANPFNVRRTSPLPSRGQRGRWQSNKVVSGRHSHSGFSSSHYGQNSDEGWGLRRN